MTSRIAGADVEVLIPTYEREASLAVTLTGLVGQRVLPGRLRVADQSEAGVAAHSPLVAGVLRVLRQRGVDAEVLHHPTGEGVIENRSYLLEQAERPYVLYLDDDIVLEPESLCRMLSAMSELRVGFVAMAMTGLSFLDDVREHEWGAFEPLASGERPGPERVRKSDPGWERWRLHNAANPTHLAQRLELSRFSDAWVAYRVAWAAGCVLFDREVLRATGGFTFWRELGRGAYGEDVVAQLRVLEAAGGVGLLPTGAHHLELPTTVGSRTVDAYETLLGGAAGDPPVDDENAPDAPGSNLHATGQS